MLEEYNKSQPKQLKEGEWHIPFGDNIDINQLTKPLLKFMVKMVGEHGWRCCYKRINEKNLNRPLCPHKLPKLRR